MATTGIVRVNGAQLYHEVRGSGPTVLFIAGATGDAGHFEKVAEHLSDEYTVITYDRRSNSRSPKPDGWTTTSMDEQADDAASLLRALDAAPAAVFGTSGGAVILLDLILRHPAVLRGAIVHEPPIFGVLPNAAELGAQLQQQVEEGMAAVGPVGTLEGFIRENAGDDAFEQMDTGLRARMLANADVFFGAELEAFVSLIPTSDALRAAGVPMIAAAGAENREVFYYDTTRWIAEAADCDFMEVPGTHAPYFLRHDELAESLRPILRKFS